MDAQPLEQAAEGVAGLDEFFANVGLAGGVYCLAVQGEGFTAQGAGNAVFAGGGAEGGNHAEEGEGGDAAEGPRVAHLLEALAGVLECLR